VDAFRNLKEARRMSFRQIAAATRTVDSTGKGLSHGYLTQLATGAAPPLRGAMTLIARALSVEPEYFAEYRLAKARAALDERETPLEEALANLASAPHLSP
jgi:transcriptional regulator with XRE-family HTH domain